MATFGLRKRKGRLLSKRYMIVGVILAAGIGIWGYASWRYRVIGTLVECVCTGRYGVGEVLLRTISPDSDILLIGPISSGESNDIRLADAPMAPTGVVYRYDPARARVESCGPDEWAKATGTITYRYLLRDFTIAPLKNNILTGSLSIDGVRIPTAGSYVVDTDVSLDHSIVNVISANERRTKGNWFFGGGYPRGPYYHETFERVTGKKVGGTYTLKDPKPLYLSFCWEAQGKYVVYHDGRGRYLWVVPGPGLLRTESAPNAASNLQLDKEKSNG